MTTTSASEQVTFRVDGKDYCCDVTFVREIRSWSPTVAVPHAPQHVLGLVNLRGTVLPIIDLASKLGFPAAVPTARHAIIVVESDEGFVGLLVESVSDIVRASPDQIQPAPDVASELARSAIKGVITLDERLICWLNVSKLVDKATLH